MLIQNTLCLILTYVGVTMVSINQARDTSCQVYPSEYAYRDDSVTRAESASANCRRYPEISGLPPGLHTTDFIHCDGTQLQLADSNLGSEQFNSSSHYQWPTGSDGRLLFIFSTRVSLTTITLHYYSDSVRGRPRLIFYAVLDSFDVWDAPTFNTPRVDIALAPSDGESAGPYSISISFNFTTMKVLMYKYTSSFQFAVSEVDFHTCEIPTSIISTAVTENSASSIIESTSKATNVVTRSTTLSLAKAIDSTTMNIPSKTMGITPGPNLITDTEILKDSVIERVTAIVVSIAILVLLVVALVIIVIALVYKRKEAQKKFYIDSSYSTLNRGTGQQIQPQPLQQDSAQLYDQIHLSPSTGQPEYIPKSETANANNTSQTPQNSNATHSTAGEHIAEHSSALNVGNQATISQLSPQNAHESTSEQPTYAAVDKIKKKKLKKDSEEEYSKCKAAEKEPPVLPYSGHEVPSASMQQKKENTTKEEINSPRIIEQVYTAVKKKPNISEPKGEEEAPPIPPPHTVEELYTAVQKNPKSRIKLNADDNKGEIPLAVDTETAPPIPPHTVEELYTAVIKKPNSGTEDEEEAPPIPPYTATL